MKVTRCYLIARADGDFDEQFFERVFQTLVDVRHEMGEATLGKDWKNA